MPIPSAPLTAPTLSAAWTRLRAERGHLRTRDAAAELGVTEAQLIAVRCAAGEGTALRPEPAPLLGGVPSFGEVMGLTRSGDAVLESVGRYGAPDIGEHTGIVLGDNIDLRIFPSGWKYAYALVEESARGPLRSLQVFDANGQASHKIYLRPAADVAAYDRHVGALRLEDAEFPQTAPEAAATAPLADGAVDLRAYREAFAGMQDTHDFFMLQRRFELSREQALRLAGPEYARELAPDAHRQLFGSAAERAVPLMIFVANHGMVQISSGLVPAPTLSGTWFNLIDPRFNLHLDESGVARAWAVHKPTVNGSVTSLEVYAADGTLIVQVFGERHSGEGERPDWRALVAALPDLTPAGT